MAKAESNLAHSEGTVTRRFALFRFGKTAAVSAAVLAAPAAAFSAGPDYFKDPSQYLTAMIAIGMAPVAGYMRRSDGSLVRMGVFEYSPDGWKTKPGNWDEYRAISKRCPVMMPDWQARVWLLLYERGHRKDVTGRCAGE